MNIAVNTRSFSKKNIFGNDIEQTMIALAKANPLHHFIFFSNNNFTEAKNITRVAIKTAGNIVSAKLWHNIQLPALLKKYKVDLLININVNNIVTSSLAQLSFISQQPEGSKKNITAIFHQSKKIITSSKSIKTLLTEEYKIADEKISVVYALPDNKIPPIDWREKQNIQKKYSDEKEYFLFIEDDQTEKELIDLLKAFSIFKKWQKSNFQLIIATKGRNLPEPFIKSLKSYKYKNEVLLIDCNEETLNEINAATYCAVHFNNNSGYLSLLQNIRLNIPLIVTENDLTKEICGAAALYSPAGNFNDIAKNMILVYKDETLRNELINNGIQQLQLLNNSRPLPTLMLLLETTLQA